MRSENLEVNSIYIQEDKIPEQIYVRIITKRLQKVVSELCKQTGVEKPSENTLKAFINKIRKVIRKVKNVFFPQVQIKTSPARVATQEFEEICDQKIPNSTQVIPTFPFVIKEQTQSNNQFLSPFTTLNKTDLILSSSF